MWALWMAGRLAGRGIREGGERTATGDIGNWQQTHGKLLSLQDRLPVVRRLKTAPIMETWKGGRRGGRGVAW